MRFVSYFGSGWIDAITVENGEVTGRIRLVDDAPGVSSFGEGTDGELYVTLLGGELAKIVPAR